MEEEDYEYGYDCGQDEEEEEEEVDDEEKLDYLADIVMDMPINFRRLKSQSSMIFIKFDDIKRVLDKKIEELEELLGLTYDEALILFHHFGWNRDKLENSDWFTNQEKISRKAGLLPIDDNLTAEASHDCPVCLFECPPEDLDGLNCGHKICKMCWSSFINEKVNLKENEFFWRCPGNINGKNCNLIVPNTFNRKYLKGENETKYMRKLCISYVEENKAIRYCPAPDCMYCIENPSLTSRTIQCRCSNVFCFRCGREDHYPCSCEIAGNWQSKNIQESENTKWIDVYTKKCPKCRNPIEKNLGCNHMTCKHSGCNFEFCWLCLDDWKTHQGSHYKCNKFESLNEEEKSSAIGMNAKEKANLEKYVFYFERFSNNERAYQIAKRLHNKMEQNVTELHQKLNLAREELYFLTEAADILQKIRKILKWTYAYAYYITDNKIKNLFEFNQKDLEKYCEELSEALELHYPKSIQVNQGVLDLKVFQCFKDKVTTLNSKCLKFSTDLSKDIEDDFIKFL